MTKDFEPVFSTLGTETSVECSADPFLCPFRKNVSTSMYFRLLICMHENAPLPSQASENVYRQCLTPEADQTEINN